MNEEAVMSLLRQALTLVGAMLATAPVSLTLSRPAQSQMIW